MPPSRPYRFSYNIRIAFLILIAAIQVPFANAETWIVTDRNHPVQAPARVRLILLDESERLEAKLSEGLPANQQQAIAIMQQRLKSNDALRLQRDLALAQQNLVDAWSIGVTKVPAVVVDRTFVVYGETNVLAAEQRIAQWRAAAHHQDEAGQGDIP
ncbi:integrating conjugative element protein [Pseudomonas savastanoi pv. retacarpa]|uniref:Integrating conjugative element protein n=1 Tax=Pseudomonas savastanoi pv. savastanoi NCPPB 3335 TaxID=693985 RepID=A0ABC8BA15_PSESS|nr:MULTISPECIES: TIGR03757 family integrating conjugative element protein [Pseudomonas]ARD10881.1 integrating conjugative element protein [Pseudomonas savastanoi pv. savastanoi NCPPB 3335]KWS79452.1 thioredoxin [Pseudomonas savastanoi pv. fraxini]MBA4706421.1 TIGR03757 family integrating conjugative element protein [Pseudomonas savastanoi pv. savastanoi]OSR27671.1 integrating conjugative element protein [Pseudomonas savastanoi pv. retacarpa]RML16485.1 Thioredoxin-like protein [Pseudomonas sava